MNRDMRFCVYILLGPGQATLNRTKDLLESFWIYAPPNKYVDCYLVTDNCTGVSQLKSYLIQFSELSILPNPLSNKSDCVNDRVTAGTLTALHAIAKARVAYDFVLKLDDDALIINPYYEALSRLFGQGDEIGMAGTVDCFPDGSSRPGLETWAPKVEMAVSLSSALREFRRSMAGHRPDASAINGFRRFLAAVKARRNGYRNGLHVQGGSYALSHTCAKRIATLTRDPFFFNHTGLGEDTSVSLVAMAAGLRLKNFNQPGETFGVWWRTPTLTPEALHGRGHSIVHSVKYDNPRDEEAVRRYYKGLRDSLERPYSVA